MHPKVRLVIPSIAALMLRLSRGAVSKVVSDQVSLNNNAVSFFHRRPDQNGGPRYPSLAENVCPSGYRLHSAINSDNSFKISAEFFCNLINPKHMPGLDAVVRSLTDFAKRILWTM